MSKFITISRCSVPTKVFLTVKFSMLYILTDYDLFGSDVEQDCSYTVFAEIATCTKRSRDQCFL